MTLQELQNQALQLPISDRWLFSPVCVNLNSTRNPIVHFSQAKLTNLN